MNYNWRITFPIEKADTRDGVPYLTGLASGPEIDAQDERMDKALIYKFADQINEQGISLTDALIYRDAHAPDGVMRDLGWVQKAWVNTENRLAVEVRLDWNFETNKGNPAAKWLYEQIVERKKQYGMSVAGKVIDFVDEFIESVGKTVRTYKDVVLTEISNTTRPAWTPSFGTVLAKAIDDAAEAESLAGVTHVENEELTQEQASSAEASAETTKADELNDTEFAAAAAVEAAETEKSEEAEQEQETTEKHYSESSDSGHASAATYTLANILHILDGDGSPEASSLRDAAKGIVAYISARVDTAGPAPAGEAEKADTESEATDEEVEKAGRKFSATAAQKLLGMYENIGATLRDLGLIEDTTTENNEPAEKADSDDEGDTLTKSDEPTVPDLDAQVQALAKSNAELTAKVAELESRPLTQVPPVIERAKGEEEDFMKSFNVLDPAAKLRVAMAMATRGK